MKKLFYVILAVLAVGCTDGQWAKVTALGDSGRVTCYSGGKVIYDGRSTGKVDTEVQSDGWYFQDATTGDLVRVSGDCVVRN